jgi:hypothetical protein
MKAVVWCSGMWCYREDVLRRKWGNLFGVRDSRSTGYHVTGQAGRLESNSQAQKKKEKAECNSDGV